MFAREGDSLRGSTAMGFNPWPRNRNLAKVRSTGSWFFDNDIYIVLGFDVCNLLIYSLVFLVFGFLDLRLKP